MLFRLKTLSLPPSAAECCSDCWVITLTLYSSTPSTISINSFSFSPLWRGNGSPLMWEKERKQERKPERKKSYVATPAGTTAAVSQPVASDPGPLLQWSGQTGQTHHTVIRFNWETKGQTVTHFHPRGVRQKLKCLSQILKYETLDCQQVRSKQVSLSYGSCHHQDTVKFKFFIKSESHHTRLISWTHMLWSGRRRTWIAGAWHMAQHWVCLDWCVAWLQSASPRLSPLTPADCW